ncbi:MAG: SRPBCC family protein [Fimbriimonas sp.]
MKVNVDENGRRSVQAEVEVPGTPEAVWHAVATGEGISSWFVPTVVDGQVGGTTTSSFGPGMDSAATITEWNPPHRFAAEGGDMGAGNPPIRTDWIVEPVDGERCIVRVVHSLSSDSDAWDPMLEQFAGGWLGFFRLLNLYLTHFSGQPCSAFQVMGVAPEPKEAAWASLVGPLGLSKISVGDRVTALEGAPAFSGVVAAKGPEEYAEDLVVRLETPAPGFANLFAMAMGGQVYLSIRFFLFGEEAPQAASQAEAIWQKWVAQTFPTEA